MFNIFTKKSTNVQHALKHPGCSFLNHPNFYSFSQHFPLKNNSKLSPRIFWHIRYRQKFLHILNYLISKPLFMNIFFNKTSNPTPGVGGFTKYPSASLDIKKKILPLSCSAPMTISFKTIPVDLTTKRLRHLSVPPNVFGINKPSQNLLWF